MVKKTFLALVVVMASLSATAQNIWDAAHLAKVKEQIKQPMYATAYRHVIGEADRLLTAEPLSVMMKNKVAASGDKHDYLSQARYFWPDPTKPDGKPYIRKDGQSNPELKLLDRPKLSNMASAVTTLSLAYYFSGDEKYAAKATQQLRVWFLDKATKMNPNLKYAQMVPGLNGEKGRSLGVIDSYSFVEMLDAVALLEHSQSFTAKDSQQLKAWFKTFLHWILTDKTGSAEGRAKNNHGTAYDVQVIAYALYVGDRATAERYISQFGANRVYKQIEPDGKQPLELERTLSFGYSQYNLTHITDVFLMAKHAGLEIGGNSREVFQRVEKAYDFMAPYMGQPVSAWPYKQISLWDEKQQEMSRDYYRAWLLDESRCDYLQIYHRCGIQNFADRFVLLYVKSDRSDNGYASAEKQLRFALKCVDAAKQKSTNPALVSPRCMEADGSLRLVKPRDWCSGFFPGSLWQMYGYTHKAEWREVADKFTWPIEQMKDCRDTHDLGFVIYNSFGQAYRLTGDARYRDVVVQAAKSLSTRYSDKVKAIRSWNHHQQQWRYPVIIDNMLNLELLFEATRITGDSTYYQMAVNHANTTLRNHFRPDGSSYHVVSYNPETGQVEKKNTHQGYSDESVWSRGQSWGLYGYTMCYRYTHNPAYLAQAQKIASFFFSLPNLPADLVPYWDMKDPAIPNAPRDASAAAVFASGLYELATYVGKADAKQYRKLADTILNSLYKNYRSKVNQNQGFLLLHSTGNYPAHDEIDKPISYADYYYLEALARKQTMSIKK